MAQKYHSIEKDGLPTKNDRYMVKIFMPNEPEYDNIELCFRKFVDGKFENPYYNNPATDKLIGWYEN